jgi:hypothetical protein
LPHRQAARIVARGIGREHDAAGAAVHRFICATPWPLMFNWSTTTLSHRLRHRRLPQLRAGPPAHL